VKAKNAVRPKPQSVWLVRKASLFGSTVRNYQKPKVVKAKNAARPKPQSVWLVRKEFLLKSTVRNYQKLKVVLTVLKFAVRLRLLNALLARKVSRQPNTVRKIQIRMVVKAKNAATPKPQSVMLARKVSLSGSTVRNYQKPKVVLTVLKFAVRL